jgi:hypothetical protein
VKQVHIIGGGTVFHVRPHFALSAPAYGKTVRDIMDILYHDAFDGIVHGYTTKMAGNYHKVWTARSGIEDSTPLNLETNKHIADLLDDLRDDPRPKVIFLPAALCDFDATSIDYAREDGGGDSEPVGKEHPRLFTGDGPRTLSITPAEKVIQRVRKTRKDIFLIGFKTTTGAAPQDQFEAGLKLLKTSSCNLVLANDLTTKLNMVITPEQAPHYMSIDRRQTLRQLVKMALLRSDGHFTRSTVVEPGSTSVDWNGDAIPDTLRKVVNHCIRRGAYKPFMGKTVGHFATRGALTGQFITSKRGVDFNKLAEVGMCLVVAEDDDTVRAYGAKPSVGGQSQRIIFREHPELDCIVHFHCPLRDEPEGNRIEKALFMPPAEISHASQEPYECGSHECGKNTSDHLKSVLVNQEGRPLLKAVMLDKHGPNIVFSSKLHYSKIIDFIDRYWDLEKSTSDVNFTL